MVTAGRPPYPRGSCCFVLLYCFIQRILYQAITDDTEAHKSQDQIKDAGTSVHTFDPVAALAHLIQPEQTVYPALDK